MSHTTVSLNYLKSLGFYPDIIGSAEKFMEFMHEKGMCELGRSIVEMFALGYIDVNDFKTSNFMPEKSDEFLGLKVDFLEAVSEIHSKFRDRLPRQFYDTLGFMALRSNPTMEERIPDLEHLLPNGMNWKTADAVLHSLPLCSRLYFDVQTIINKRTGRIIGHGCGCSHSLAQMPDSCVVNASMGDSDAVMLEETESFFRHILGQYFLLNFGLPQGMGPSLKMNLRDIEKVVLKKTIHS